MGTADYTLEARNSGLGFEFGTRETCRRPRRLICADSAYVETIPALPAQLGICVSYPAPAGCSTVLMYGQKHDLNAYLAATPGAPVHTLADIIAFNAVTPGALKYGQAIFEAAEQLDVTPGSADTIRYLDDLAEDRARSRGALDDVYDGADHIRGTADDFDAILASENRFAGTPAKAGYPSITVPGSFLPPCRPNRQPVPVGCHVHRSGILGADAHCVRLRVRTGHTASAPACQHAAAAGRYDPAALGPGRNPSGVTRQTWWYSPAP